MAQQYKKFAIILMTATSLFAAGCAESVGQKEGVGTLAGAALGGWAGSQIGSGEGRGLAIATGVILGGLFGNQIGKGLDKADRLAAERAASYAFENNPSGRASSWSNPDTGHSGTITPKPAYRNQEGQDCREYTQTIRVGGREEKGYGTACRQPDGSWKISG